jgi:DNA-binding NarL/FixJ family response regulator
LLATASSVDELLRGAGRRAQLVLLDLRLSPTGDDDVADSVGRIRAAGPQVVVLTSELRPVPLRAAVSAGAVGVVLKGDPPETLVATIRAARTGELAMSSALAHALVTDERLVGRLSPREQEVFSLLAQGVGRTEIGRLLSPPVSTHAVDAYVKKVAERYRELGRSTFNSYETLAHVIRDGYLDYRP